MAIASARDLAHLPYVEWNPTVAERHGEVRARVELRVYVPHSPRDCDRLARTALGPRQAAQHLELGQPCERARELRRLVQPLERVDRGRGLGQRVLPAARDPARAREPAEGVGDEPALAELGGRVTRRGEPLMGELHLVRDEARSP